MADAIKAALRNSIKQVRSKISSGYVAKSSTQICRRIRSLDAYRKAKHIALYNAANGEVNLAQIWKRAPMHGKYCYFPCLKEKERSLLFLPANPKTPFKQNRYGIYEPEVGADLAIDPEQLDVIFVPLVAFDADCTRLGMGAGYYDRTLENKKKCLLIGVAHQFQCIDYIEPQAWDVPLDAVVTNKTIYWREKT